jgi:heme/copper-type cytochrome/quinol oxidase subunit 4
MPERRPQFAWVDESTRLVVTYDSDITFAVQRAEIHDVRLETRSSFRHPIIGGVIAIVLVALPVSAVLGDPFDLWWLFLATPMRIVGAISSVFFGMYLFVLLLSRHDELWVVFELEGLSKDVCLQHALSEVDWDVLNVLRADRGLPPLERVALRA